MKANYTEFIGRHFGRWEVLSVSEERGTIIYN